MKLTDNLRTVIHPNEFELVIENFCHSAILLNYDETGLLTVAQRQKMIQLVAEFMVERFGDKISVDEKITVAKAIVELFPSLVTKGKNLKPYVC